MTQRKNLRHTPGVNQGSNEDSPRVTASATLQRKPAVSNVRQPPAAPPVYRPQPLPRVLQTKKSAPAPSISQPGMNNRRQPEIVKRIALPTRAAANQPRPKETTVQPFASRIVQATKFYPNLHPGAAEPID